MFAVVKWCNLFVFFYPPSHSFFYPSAFFLYSAHFVYFCSLSILPCLFFLSFFHSPRSPLSASFFTIPHLLFIPLQPSVLPSSFLHCSLSILLLPSFLSPSLPPCRYKKTQETLSQAGQKTSAALTTVGTAISRRLGDMR